MRGTVFSVSFLNRLFVLVSCLFLFSVVSRAQGPAPGTPMYSSFDNQNLATINLQNLNVQISIPITTVPSLRCPG